MSIEIDGQKAYAPEFGIPAVYRLERYELQAAVRSILPRERVTTCLLTRLPAACGVQVLHSPAGGSALYADLMVCGSVWLCPVCAAKISERRREELVSAIGCHRAAGGEVLLASFTVHHGRSDALSDMLGRFLAAQRSMTGNRTYRALRAAYGVVGVVKALEVTWGAANGWHPHTHWLLFLAAGVEVEQVAGEL
jgi:hypothetical protein